MELQIMQRVHSGTCEMRQKNNFSPERASSHRISTCPRRHDMRAQDFLELFSVQHKLARKVQENTSPTAESTMKDCACLCNLAKTCDVFLFVSACTRFRCFEKEQDQFSLLKRTCCGHVCGVSEEDFSPYEGETHLLACKCAMD